MKHLENDKIVLRALEPEDLETLYRWENDTEIWRHGSTLTPYSRFALRDYLNNSLTQDIFQSHQLRLVIVSKENRNCLGTIDLYDFDPIHSRAGIGILIDKNYRRQNIGLQALELMKNYASAILNLQQLYAYISTSNEASYRLFIKSGFSESGLLKDWVKTDNGFEDALILQGILLKR
ncbi:MAG: GNAT family N-acetyltransferase [Candidatus Symbiothrix sp.]|jgi:diamine N-acetyltransferase|nr:GNAT family N-acetyltransferase [Candidatus Symbiothrix sp.]